MAANDFSETLNAALKSQDWPLVIVLGEGALADGKASDALRYNLGLAYLKTAKPAMATAVLVSVPEPRRDEGFKALIQESLRLSSASIDDFNTGAHGLTSTLCQMATGVHRYDALTWSVTTLGLTVVLVFTRMLAQKFTSSKNIIRSTGVATLICGFATLTALGATALDYFYQSRWGVVVAEREAPIHGLPSENASVVKNLKSGKPVLVLGNPSSAWVHVIESDGASGWMGALDVRVVRE
jgi:hypothetical protein